jgi:hypothetical protein
VVVHISLSLVSLIEEENMLLADALARESAITLYGERQSKATATSVECMRLA